MPLTSSDEQNWQIKGDLAYTEDGVLIKNLFFFVDFKMISGIKEMQAYFEGGEKQRHLAPQQQLQKYFETFGCVERFNLYPIENGSLTGYVVFANPFDAAKALRDPHHKVSGCRIQLVPSYSWHQPDAEKLPHGPEILKLNDHCLEHIFKQLSLTDRINFARTCFRFRNIYEGMSPVLDKSINFNLFGGMTAWDLRDFFQLSGQNIKNIEGDTDYLERSYFYLVCAFLGVHCLNLHSMEITLNRDDSNKLLFNLKHLRKLKKLDLFGLYLTYENMTFLPNSIESLTLTTFFTRETIPMKEILGRLPLLKELHLSIPLHKDLIDASIHTLFSESWCKSLEVLSIELDSGVLAEFEIIARLPSLKKLKVFISNLNERDEALKPFTLLVEHKSEQLEHLEIRRSNHFDDETLLEIGKLTALQSLILPVYKDITDRGLEALFALQDLREIDCSFSPKITDNGVLRLILNCPKLQVLHLEFCKKLTIKLCHDIILNIQNNQYNRPLPIKLFMKNNKFYKITL